MVLALGSRHILKKLYLFAFLEDIYNVNKVYGKGGSTSATVCLRLHRNPLFHFLSSHSALRIIYIYRMFAFRPGSTSRTALLFLFPLHSASNHRGRSLVCPCSRWPSVRFTLWFISLHIDHQFIVWTKQINPCRLFYLFKLLVSTKKIFIT